MIGLARLRNTALRAIAYACGLVPAIASAQASASPKEVPEEQARAPSPTAGTNAPTAGTKAAPDSVDEGEKDEDPGGWTGLPIIGYAPETSLLLGAVVLYRFDVGRNATDSFEGEPRPLKSSIMGVGAYSIKSQMILVIEPNIFLDGDNWRLYGGVNYILFPDILYALGQDSPDSYEEYGQRLFAISAGAERKIIGALKAGAGAKVAHAEITESEAGGLLATDSIVGSEGGYVIGFGPTVAWDDRDTDTATTSGGRYEIKLDLNLEALGSDYGFTHAIIQARQFYPLWAEHVLALEFFMEMTAGNVPFQMMAALGGASRMRGYYEGRYRDNHQIVLQAEYRLPIWWRFGAVAFTSVGNVAPTFSSFNLDDPKFAAGAGLRFAVSPKERVNFRVDFAATREGDTNLYIGLLEAF